MIYITLHVCTLTMTANNMSKCNILLCGGIIVNIVKFKIEHYNFNY